MYKSEYIMDFLRSKYHKHYRRMTTTLRQKHHTKKLAKEISNDYFNDLSDNFKKVYNKYTKHINMKTARGLAYTINKSKKHKKGWRFIVYEDIYCKIKPNSKQWPPKIADEGIKVIYEITYKLDIFVIYIGHWWYKQWRPWGREEIFEWEKALCFYMTWI